MAVAKTQVQEVLEILRRRIDRDGLTVILGELSRTQAAMSNGSFRETIGRLIEANEAFTMTRHDLIRKMVAESCDRDNIESLQHAILTLQATDDPSLLPLHDELMEIYRTKLSQQLKKEEPKGAIL